MLHVFDAACNLIDESAEVEVISLVAPQIGDGPFNIVTPPVKFSDHVSPTDRVVCRQNLLTVGALTVDIAPAPVWNPRPPWDALRGRRDRFRRCAPLLLGVLQDAPPGSFAGLLTGLSAPASGSGVEAETLRAARTYTGYLMAGLQHGDQALCLKGAANLAGLGGGLTPAGDDWLVGCLLATWIGLPNPGASALAWSIAETAARHTTALSAAWLRAAARGECSALWRRLFESALIEGEDVSTICEAAKKIARQGHTSGTDALAGFVAWLT
ncbi:MAG: DUF2877 domain-containing protein [Anaerolineae bacterium]|nr:DUF2877 domain-containing protein [Anaerolineae bacterium]